MLILKLINLQVLRELLLFILIKSEYKIRFVLSLWYYFVN